MVKEWCYIVLGGFRPLTCCNCCLNSSSKSDILWKPGLSTADKNILINMSGSPPFPQSQKLTVRDFIGIQEAPPQKKAQTGAFGQWRHAMFHIFKGFLVDLPKRTNIEAGFIIGFSSKCVSNQYQCQPIMSSTNHGIESIKNFFYFSYLLTFNPSYHSPASLPWCPAHHGSNPIGPWYSEHPNSSASPSFCRTRSRKINGNTSWYAAGWLSHKR